MISAEMTTFIGDDDVRTAYAYRRFRSICRAVNRKLVRKIKMKKTTGQSIRIQNNDLFMIHNFYPYLKNDLFTLTVNSKFKPYSLMLIFIIPPAMSNPRDDDA